MGVAHELSNPLTSILGYAQRLLANNRGRENEREIQQIFQEAERAASILQQLLLDARGTPTERRTVALNQVVSQAIALQQSRLDEENIHVELDLDPALSLVQGDPGRLQQVVMNLTGNARQAIAQTGRGGTIRVRTKQIGENRVLLEVDDDGPGIPPHLLSRIFEPFFTTKPPGTGTGLGLAIVLGIVRESGGHINVASPPGGGAIFSVALRAALGGQREASFATADPTWPKQLGERREFPAAYRYEELAEMAEAVGPGQSFENRILVVEDEPTVAQLIADVLEEDGFLVEIILNGRDALRRAASEDYDLVICDMKMPGLDGQHFYKALVRAKNPLHERFLFVAGDVVSPSTNEFLTRNRLPHVAKPFRVEELAETVRSLLKKTLRAQLKGAEPSKIQ